MRGAEIGSAKQIIRTGDVLLSRIVPHIRRAWIVGQHTSHRIIASGEWIVFRAAIADPRYLRHFLTSDGFHRQLMNTVAGVGGSLLRARPSQVAEIQVSLPESSEQRRIADILDKADAIRRKRKEAIALTEELLRSAFLERVGPAARDYPTWPVRTIESLAAKVPNAMRTGPFGSDLRHSEFVDDGIAVLGIDNAVQNRFAWGERRFITREKYDDLRRYTVRPGDVIVTIMGTTGRSAVVPDDIPTAITTKHLATITLDRKQAEPEFVSQALFRHPEVLQQITAANRGAIMSGLNLGLIKALRIPVPPIERQREFARVTLRVRAVTARMTTDTATEDLFNTLVARAFSGKLS
ncbi:MAG: restriction endonuclease subunit S [Planctomycetes bacterium]|nr:restriction endonuclease subunit S [Planctomycetota bacterium]